MRLVSLLLTLPFFSLAADVDTVLVHSKSMNRAIKSVVITPASYKSSETKFPVLYLLHGYSGNYADWVKKVKDLKSLVDQHNMIVVCPDGAFGSWYVDSPVSDSLKYETHISTELPEYIDNRYRTITTRYGRAITGLSMGGHGAMFIAFRHAEKFGACGSMSGALMLHLITKGYGMSKVIGDTINYKKYYEDWSVYNLIEKKPSMPLNIIVDCGTEDFIYGMSKATHEKLLQLKIEHDYIERPGKHDWPYWNNAIKYQLVFFSEYFKKNLEERN